MSKNYPCNKGIITSHEVFNPVGLDLLLHKVRCGSTWCPSCFKSNGKKRIQKRLSIFDWPSTRHIMLSIDRDQFESGEEAYKLVTEKHLIPNLIRNLIRIKSIQVLDWMWILEWHKDGFPHWHLFIQVEKEGKEGMIGGIILRQYWPWGKWITERPIWDENHWKNICGYFDKHGYFGKEKGVQNKLPEWAVKWVSHIRRYGTKILQKVDEEKTKKNCSFFRDREIEKRSYWCILEQCGQKTRVTIKNWQISVCKVVDVAYYKLRDVIEGEYVPGVGYLAQVDQGAFFLLSERFPGLVELIDEILEKETIYHDWIWDRDGAERVYKG